MLVLTTRMTSSKSWSRKPLPRPRPALASKASTGRPPISRIELVDAFECGEIRLQSVDLGAHGLEILGGLLDLGLVGDDHQIEAFAAQHLASS